MQQRKFYFLVGVDELDRFIGKNFAAKGNHFKTITLLSYREEPAAEEKAAKVLKSEENI